MALAALAELERDHRTLGGPELEAALLLELSDRRRTIAALARRSDPSTAIAAQVSYDAALVLLCRARGLAVAAAAFGDPAVARRLLEAALAGGGIPAEAFAARSAL